MDTDKKGNYTIYLDVMMDSKGFYSTNGLFVNVAGLSTNISSSTLRHTSPQLSFPKSSRFQTLPNVPIPCKLDLPSQLASRTTTSGFGNKIIFQYQWQKHNAEELPPPDRYEVRTAPGKEASKHSFGLPFEVYSKNFLPYNKHQSPDVAKFLPGPGEYQVRKELGTHKYQFILKGKGKMLNDGKDNGVPSPDTYTPVDKLTSPGRFLKIGLGIGDKKSPFNSASFTPGPGRYEAMSAFDRFRRKRQFHLSQGERRPFI